MSHLRAAWRCVLIFIHVLRGWWRVWRQIGSWTEEQQAQVVQGWSQQLLGIMGITVQVHGQPPAAGPVLLVSNHLSWLDIPAIHAARNCRFVAKADIRHWPLVSMLATGCETLFIERTSRRDAMRVVHQMADALRQGDVLAVFPEGTTGDGRTMLPFHANLLQAALVTNTPAQPMALKFVDTATGQATYAPSFVGDETLLGSVWRTLTAPPITAIVRFGEPQRSAGRDRREWAGALEEVVEGLWRGPELGVSFESDYRKKGSLI